MGRKGAKNKLDTFWEQELYRLHNEPVIFGRRKSTAGEAGSSPPSASSSSAEAASHTAEESDERMRSVCLLFVRCQGKRREKADNNENQ
ncbi:hypothetical protein QOT17_019777, partial [Balamuthia mandrillaris]